MHEVASWHPCSFTLFLTPPWVDGSILLRKYSPVCRLGEIDAVPNHCINIIYPIPFSWRLGQVTEFFRYVVWRHGSLCIVFLTVIGVVAVLVDSTPSKQSLGRHRCVCTGACPVPKSLAAILGFSDIIHSHKFPFITSAAQCVSESLNCKSCWS